jgi:Ni,Fe-hydrogenase III large subunit
MRRVEFKTGVRVCKRMMVIEGLNRKLNCSNQEDTFEALDQSWRFDRHL